MELRWIDSEGASNHDLGELEALLHRKDGFLWLDIPEWDDDAEAQASFTFIR